MIPIHKLHYAVVLSEHRSFRKAAEVLNLTQPALSRSIRSLETALGARLFDRAHGGIESTAVGRLVVNRSREIVARVIDLEDEVERMRGFETGDLEVSLGPYPSALSGRLAVARFFATHPEIQCRIRVAGYRDVAEDVAHGRCELGIADIEVASDNGLATEVVVDRPTHFFARPEHPLSSRSRCSLTDVLNYPWAAIRFPERAGKHLPDDLGRAGHRDAGTGEFVPALEADVVSDLLAVAHDSDILVAATLTMAEQDLEDRKLAVVPFHEPWFRLLYGFITRPNRTLSPAAEEFLKIVREIEADLEAHESSLRDRFL